MALDLAIGGLAGRRLLIGFSGGLDSTVLLHTCSTRAADLRLDLRAIHVDHGLQADSKAWARHCLQVCAELGVELVVEQVTVRDDEGRGREAAAREARHAAFAAHLRPGECLALGHHRDDQAETVLLRLLRASGGEGLSAIRPSRTFGSHELLRPLLDMPRDALLQYARAAGLAWIEDPSNADQSLDRNFVRHRVLPLLRERWVQADRSLSRSAALLAEDSLLLESCVVERLRRIAPPGARCMDARELAKHDAGWRSRILRRWVQESGLPPLPGKAIDVIESDLLSCRPDAQAEFRWRGGRLRMWRGILHLEGGDPLPFPAGWKCPWDGAGVLPLPGGDTLAFVPTHDPRAALEGGDAPDPLLRGLVVRGRRGGERITLPGRTRSHALRNCLQERSVPPWLRDRLPLVLAADGELLAVGDWLVSARLDSYCQQHSLRLLHRRVTPTAHD